MNITIPPAPPRQSPTLVTVKRDDLRGVVAEAPVAAAAARLKPFACPVCAGSVARIHRRLIDHVVGVLIFMPLRRYQCRSADCGWRGNLNHARVDPYRRGGNAPARG